MEPYRIIVVDDSAFMRKLFSDIIESDPAFTVIAVGKTGREAVELHRELKPDAITIDLEMPEMNGIEALKRIMAEAVKKTPGRRSRRFRLARSISSASRPDQERTSARRPTS